MLSELEREDAARSSGVPAAAPTTLAAGADRASGRKPPQQQTATDSAKKQLFSPLSAWPLTFYDKCEMR